jgi:hypothetical protein
MIPKSTASLTVGDACFISRTDGRHVPFVYVGRRGKDRAYLFGAFADVAVDKPEIDSLPQRMTLREHALVHVKSYQENNTPIVGNVRARLSDEQLERITADIASSSIGQTTRVWGWRTLIEKANHIGRL